MATAQNAAPAKERHWREDTDSNSKYFTHADIAELSGGGTELTVQIAAATPDGIETPGEKKKRAVLLRFVGVERPLGLNPTNGAKVEELLGTGIYARWVGRSITVYITRCDRPRKKTDPEAGPGEKERIINVPCVRVRQKLPGPTTPVYGVKAATGPDAPPDFDLDGWRATLADCGTVEELAKARAELNAIGLKGDTRKAIAVAIETARVRITEPAA